MSKEKDTQQILLQEDFHANHSALQEKENQQQMIATSGMKCLESLEKSNQDGLLAKMLKALLISTKAWYSDRCLLTWKTKVSKANVLLFQLQASVRGINENESGFLPTPTTMDHIDRKGMRPSRAATNRKTGYLSEMIKMYPTPTQDSASERTRKYKQGGMPLTMAVKMFPTPTASDIEGGAAKDVQIENGHFFRENKKGVRWGVKLRDAIEMYPTPTHSEHKYRLKGNTQASKCLEAQARRLGGKLNPNFVEFLMGYPMNWTKIDPTE